MVRWQHVWRSQQKLYQQIAGSHFMIALANGEGITLDLLADESFRATAEAADLYTGTRWGEANHGTNALGTAAVCSQPILVHSAEHFFRKYGHLTCTAAPIFAPNGQVVGILDATSDCRAPQLHTLALVRMVAHHIETALFTHSFPHALVLRLYPGAEGDDTTNAGMIAVNGDGVLLAADRQAHLLLHGLPLPPGQPFERLFAASFAACMDTLYGPGPARLTDVQGRTYWVTGRPAQGPHPHPR